MAPSEPEAVPLVEVGGTIELVGHLFEVTGHTTDAAGHVVEIPGKCLGKAVKQPNKRAGQSVAVAPKVTDAHLPIAPSSPPKTPAPRRQKAHRYKAGPSGYRQPYRKPPPLKIVYEPWPLSSWLCLIVVLALVVAGIWISSAGAEAAKWSEIHAAARAVRGY